MPLEVRLSQATPDMFTGLNAICTSMQARRGHHSVSCSSNSGLQGRLFDSFLPSFNPRHVLTLPNAARNPHRKLSHMEGALLGQQLTSTKHGPTLCENCTRLDLHALLFPRDFKSLRFQMQMKKLESVRAHRAFCVFCDLIYKCASKLPGVDQIDSSQSAYIVIDPYPFGKMRTRRMADHQQMGESKVVDEDEEEKKKKREKFVARSIVDVMLGSESQSFKHTRSVFACGLQVVALDLKMADSPRENLLLAREVGSTLNGPLIEHWINKCVKHHSACQSDVFDELPPFSRLVDVKNRCITERLPTSCRFVALSYVWGQAEQLLLTKATRNRLSTVGRLDIAHFDDIPGTI